MDLLQLLQSLGHLEGSVWHPKLMGEQVEVRVYSLEGTTVTFGSSKDSPQRVSARYFLRWFKPKISLKSDTSAGGTRP